ncbi:MULTISPECIES: hypothetical protein [Streptomyces]|uniref:hypothetical protein n=1 Tax=Streptomyces TaxID=1883 RepID=UPI0001DEF932|nr:MULTISPECIES: hypothetical protein [Streptomyces]EFL20191.1 predicted protein [Streptomyces sp. C]RST05666.1 hypothetical protein EF910_12795 [Streptomyces sp. WAC07149]GLX22934.1 hypothetical protein Slala01_65780 [Streptomyces lavendulae subsp. lavendulae]GLX30214.1 hypothetical protein Slala02_60340 [Streptomyces lavendulae subsp. lavendulae]
MSSASIRNATTAIVLAFGVWGMAWTNAAQASEAVTKITVTAPKNLADLRVSEAVVNCPMDDRWELTCP